MKFLLLTLSLISSTSFAVEPLHYHYDSSTGKCVDKDNNEGLNHPEPARMFVGGTDKTKSNKVYSDVDVECTDFRGFNFNSYIGFGGTRFINWNMSGARFDEAKFHFADMVDCNLKGSDLSKLSYGYSNLTGDTDKNTKLPQGCENKNNKASCRR